jgi:hypothetical protein
MKSSCFMKVVTLQSEWEVPKLWTPPPHTHTHTHTHTRALLILLREGDRSCLYEGDIYFERNMGSNHITCPMRRETVLTCHLMANQLTCKSSPPFCETAVLTRSLKNRDGAGGMEKLRVWCGTYYVCQAVLYKGQQCVCYNSESAASNILQRAARTSDDGA